MRTLIALTLIGLTLTACGDYEPRSKQAVYDPSADELVMPYPCPDWSRSSNVNFANVQHSNFGCAVENNLAVQLEDPKDLLRGHGARGPDLELSTHVIEQYRAGTLPAPLTPMQKDQTSE